ncbi:hypothetical protein [Nocardia sp. XZ_19_385]|uniref:hypothetical protein n=1 Tax=Nocardia sp. XZ_19_385 TaxID=2769488 RepID=UPI00188F6103|nr:hypothetical protein [Nocardia sp. XZ_19_385]
MGISPEVRQAWPRIRSEHAVFAGCSEEEVDGFMRNMSASLSARVVARTVVAATLALAPIAVVVPTASARPCHTPTEPGCRGGINHDHPGHPHHPNQKPRTQPFDDDNSRYDRFGYDLLGYDRSGYDRSGYDWFGYDRSGYDKQGCARSGADRPGADQGACERRRQNRPSTGSAS